MFFFPQMLQNIDVKDTYLVTRVFMKEFSVNLVHACVRDEQFYFGGIPQSAESS